MNWTIIFALLALAGPIVIAASAKRRPRKKNSLPACKPAIWPWCWGALACWRSS